MQNCFQIEKIIEWVQVEISMDEEDAYILDLIKLFKQ
jgi:hypothetical protein